MTFLHSTPAQSLKRKYNLINFVETGCEQGIGTAYANFIGFTNKNIYTCDLRKEAIDTTLSKVPNINIEVLDSTSYLKKILPSLNEKTLFWLDAHYPSAYGVEDTKDTKMPLVEEIKLIKQLKYNYKYDVFICDDMRVFADSRNPRYIPNEIPEYYYVYNEWETFSNILTDTHNFSVYFVAEGIGVFTPKNGD